MVEIQESLRMAMARKNINQAELARRAGVSRSTISLIVRGRRVPSLGLAKKIARELGITVETL